MTLDELHARQQRDLDDYKVARDKYWEDLKKGHSQINEAVGGEKHVPENIKRTMQKDIETYHKEWSMYSGERHKAILEKHKKEREAITGKAKHSEPATEKKRGDALSDEQQAKLKKIIAQQQAIRKHAQEKKPKR